MMNTITVKRDLRYFSVAVTALGFWLVAAAGVVTADQMLQRLSPGACLAAKIAVIALVAGMYMRFAAREASMQRAVVAGIVWTCASVVGELIIVSSYNRTWYPFFGSPAHSAFRNILLIAWIGSAALFARQRD